MTLAPPPHPSNTDRSGTPLMHVTVGRCPVLPLPPAQCSAYPASFLFAHHPATDLAHVRESYRPQGSPHIQIAPNTFLNRG